MNWSAELVALVPHGVVTVTSTVSLPAGEVAVIWGAELTVGGTEVVPNLTAVAPLKLVPLMVTLVPPFVVTELGVIDVIVGIGA